MKVSEQLSYMCIEWLGYPTSFLSMFSFLGGSNQRIFFLMGLARSTGACFVYLKIPIELDVY